MEQGKYRILLVDDDANLRDMIRVVLEEFGKVDEAQNGEEARELFHKNEYHIILLDYLLPDTDGLKLLMEFKEQQPNSEIVLISMVNEINVAVDAIKKGAFDYFHKDFSIQDLKALLFRVIEQIKRNQEMLYLRSEVERLTDQDFIFGQSPKMKGLEETLQRAASTSATVLIQGESGTGKELIARYLHQKSPRVHRPFVAVNMASIHDNLMEPALFGHEKGAFTGALKKTYGKFELADGGTLFCDEIADLKLELQSKLLRVIQESEFERVGGSKPIRIDVRLITASNRDLKKMVREGSFREDLFYRLNVVPLVLPPLRERVEDLPLFVELFLQKYNRKYGRKIRFSPEVLGVLSHNPWPGNVRELENLVERMVALNPAPVIRTRHLPLDYQLPELNAPEGGEETPDRLKEATDAFERGYLMRVLEKVGWHQEKAAERMGIHRKTLEYKLKKLKLQKIVQEKQGRGRS